MRKHRGLSAIVGTVFLVAVVIGALSYVTYSMNVLGNFSESLIVEEKRQKDQKEEAFEITSISVNQNKLDGIIKNTGEIPIRITNLYVDEQGVNDDVQKFAIDEDILPGNIINLINSIDYDVDPTKGYNVKLVSSRGAVQTIYINSPSSENLLMNIRAVPEFVPSEFTTTILYSIVNNMSNNNVLYNVTPQLTINDVVGTEVAKLRSGPNPTSYPVLAPGDVAIFEYVVVMSGEIDDSAIFNATIANGVPGNFVTTTSTVREVTVATQAGTALESFGLSTEISNNLNVLNFHDENSLTPNGEYQMDGSDVEGTGSTAYLEDNDYEFLTANVTSTTTVLPGNWNITLAYYNELVPEGITAPSFAFMMECKDCPGAGDIFDTMGNIDKDFRDNGLPTWYATNGPDNKAYFYFDGNDDFRAEWNAETEYTTYSDIQAKAVTTAVWFRIPDTSDQYMPIVRWGDENDATDDEYEIALGAKTAGTQGDIVYRYATEIDTDETRCITTDGYDYDDGQWHFAVGTRSGDDDCELYVDGVLKDTTPECINGPCSGSSLVQVDDPDDIFIGFDGASDYLIGDVAMFMHWNTVSLSAANILDLYNTNYGTNATRAQITIEKTNGVGTPINPPLYDQEFSFSFHDTSIKGDLLNDRIDLQKNDDDYKKYNAANFTFNTIANTTFNVGERLKTTIAWSGDSQNLPLHFRFDDEDTNFDTYDILTYLQTPDSVPSWPTFLSFDRDTHITYLVFNSGPNGAWFTYGGTRFVITTSDGSNSYGAIVETINGTTVDSTKDSIFIPNQAYAEIEFYPLKNPPIASTGGGTKPPVGAYTASVFLSGFDDKGEVFLRTIGLGTVNVHDNG